MAGQAFSGNIVTRAGFVAQIGNMGALPLRGGRLAADVGSVEAKSRHKPLSCGVTLPYCLYLSAVSTPS